MTIPPLVNLIKEVDGSTNSSGLPRKPELIREINYNYQYSTCQRYEPYIMRVSSVRLCFSPMSAPWQTLEYLYYRPPMLAWPHYFTRLRDDTFAFKYLIHLHTNRRTKWDSLDQTGLVPEFVFRWPTFVESFYIYKSDSSYFIICRPIKSPKGSDHCWHAAKTGGAFHLVLNQGTTLPTACWQWSGCVQESTQRWL